MIFLKIQLSDIQGTGKEGRILKEDILHHIENLKRGPKGKFYSNLQSKY